MTPRRRIDQTGNVWMPDRTRAIIDVLCKLGPRESAPLRAKNWCPRMPFLEPPGRTVAALALRSVRRRASAWYTWLACASAGTAHFLMPDSTEAGMQSRAWRAPRTCIASWDVCIWQR
ncbi:hypothetical protein BD311DRAFT_92022 [Dichomitus squalens]|uniref:Uncharacterized protein n=1 Tax=Dichomitus squalens TaxID=114155 RepID=A0A4Q9M847_9APHY|nr:hypothetical protein BD311DRAFT_92022 [Dichomitus squalens]